MCRLWTCAFSLLQLWDVASEASPAVYKPSAVEFCTLRLQRVSAQWPTATTMLWTRRWFSNHGVTQRTNYTPSRHSSVTKPSPLRGVYTRHTTGHLLAKSEPSFIALPGSASPSSQLQTVASATSVPTTRGSACTAATRPTAQVRKESKLTHLPCTRTNDEHTT